MLQIKESGMNKAESKSQAELADSSVLKSASISLDYEVQPLAMYINLL